MVVILTTQATHDILLRADTKKNATSSAKQSREKKGPINCQKIKCVVLCKRENAQDTHDELKISKSNKN